MADETAELDQAKERAATFYLGVRYALASLMAAVDKPELVEKVILQARQDADTWDRPGAVDALLSGAASQEIFKDELLARLRAEGDARMMERRLAGEQ